MPPLASHSVTPVKPPVDYAIHRILVVDDSRAQRRVLVATLTRLGFDVIEAESGREALHILGKTQIDLVLSDWMMPGINGLDLCRKFREMPRDSYGYYILMTSKSEKGAVAQGLDVGADDFLTKPVNPEELRARIAAGERILRMERELNEKNRLVSATLEEISSLYDALDRDLIEARKMQQALVRDRLRQFDHAQVALMLKPSGHVGGDLVGSFDAGSGRIGLYAIDVSGHGVASALLTARLAGHLSDGVPAQNIAMTRVSDGAYEARPVEDVALSLNKLMLSEVKSDLYFTMALAYFDPGTGEVELTQCGHPNPVVLTGQGEAVFLGKGGLPIGLITDATYERAVFRIKPGERLLLYSDGFTECRSVNGLELEEAGFGALIEKNANLPPLDFYEALVWDLDQVSGGKDFPDDLSCIMLDYKGPSLDK